MAYVNQCIPSNLNPQFVYWNPTILSNNQLQLQLQQFGLRNSAGSQRQSQAKKNNQTRQIQSQKVSLLIKNKILNLDNIFSTYFNMLYFTTWFIFILTFSCRKCLNPPTSVVSVLDKWAAEKLRKDRIKIRKMSRVSDFSSLI